MSAIIVSIQQCPEGTKQWNICFKKLQELGRKGQYWLYALKIISKLLNHELLKPKIKSAWNKSNKIVVKHIRRKVQNVTEWHKEGPE